MKCNKLELMRNLSFLALIFLFSCNEKTLIYTEIDNNSESLKTAQLSVTNQKVHQVFPSSSNIPKLFFGSVKESDNLFSLVQMTLFSGYIPPTSLEDLLSDSIQVDSAMVFFQTADSLNSSSKLSLYSIIASEDSIFSDSLNYYSMDNFIDFNSSSQFLSEISLNDINPDSTGFDTLKFMFHGEELDDLKNYFFDVSSYPARTFMLKADDNLTEFFTIESAESSNTPKMRVWYKSFIDEQTVVDTFITFFSQEDITVFSPPEVESEDHDYISTNWGSGLQSIIELDISLIDSLSRNEIFKNSNLILSVENSNLDENEEYFVVATALQDSVSNWDFSSFLDADNESENYLINPGFIISRKIENEILKIPVQAFLQGYKNGIFKNNELMIYSSSANNPFSKVRFNVENIEVLYVSP